MIRINLVSGPRNISTALMYSFGQRPDTVVIDEPFYAHYLHETKADHPGKDEVLKSQPVDATQVKAWIMGDWPAPVLFIKNMAHHMELLDEVFFRSFTNVFLIRDPKQIITSYAQVITQPRMRDIGIAYQFELFSKFRTSGTTPVVVDSGLLLQNPSTVLKQLCHKCGIPFTTDMLHWNSGPKPYDGVWARHWYHNVHQSQGFETQPARERPLAASLGPLYEEANLYYQKLLPFSLKP